MRSNKQIVRGTGKRPSLIADICKQIAVDRSVEAEIKGRNEIVIRGCKRICEYTPQIISLKIMGGTINVCGKDLTCFSFSQSNIGIQGKIKCIFFADDSKKGGKEK